MDKPNKKPPVLTLRIGGLSFSAWENDSTTQEEMRPWLTFTMKRRYRDRSGDWKDTQCFSLRDLLDIALLCHRMYERQRVNESSRPGKTVPPNEKDAEAEEGKDPNRDSDPTA